MGGLKKSNILRGHGRFRNVLMNGQKVEGELLRCYVLRSSQVPGSIQFGIVVPSKRFRATRRNRIKRLIRESVAASWDNWVEGLMREGSSCDVIVYYKGSLLPERTRLRDIDDDLHRIRAVIVRKKL